MPLVDMQGHLGVGEETHRFEPAFAAQLIDVHCDFTFHLSVLAHSRDAALMRALHAGSTGLSRLDGEWWMHFADGPWS